MTSLVVAILLSLAGSASAAITQFWAGSGGTTNAPASGTWTNGVGTGTIWSDGTSSGGNSTWTNGNSAFFGGADGTYAITVGGAISGQGVFFLNSGYTLSAASAQTVSLPSASGFAAPQLRLGAGVTATIGTNVTLQNSQATGLWIGASDTNASGTLNISGKVAQNSANTGGLDGFGTVVNVLPGGSLLGPIGSSSGGYVVGRNTGANCTVNVNGGTFGITSGNTVAMTIGSSGTGTVSVVSGAFTMSKDTGNGIVLGTVAGIPGTLNLNGGVTTTPKISMGAAGTMSVLNFNGGTLKANANTVSFVSGLTTANVRNGGAMIDNSGLAVTIGQSLLHTTNVLDNATDGGLTSSGSGTLTLAGANTYNGPTIVSAGTLVFDSGSSGISSWLQVNTGAVCQVLTTLPILATDATVSINSGGQLNLTNGVNLTVSYLLLNGVCQPAGTWGSSSSPAANKNDTYFSGPGILTVNGTLATPRYWVGASGTIDNPTSGTWSNGAANVWSDGRTITANTTWTAGSTAVFGGVDGNYGIRVTNAISTVGMNFLASGYTLTNNTAQTITATNNPFIAVDSGKTATIGANVTFSFAGTTVRVNTASTASGTLVVENGGIVQQTVNGNLVVVGSNTLVSVKAGGIFRDAYSGSGSPHIVVGNTDGDDVTLSVDGGAVSVARTTASFWVPGQPLSPPTVTSLKGTLTVNGGTLKNTNAGATSVIVLGQFANYAGTLNLNGGTVTIQAVQSSGTNGLPGAGMSVLNFNGGTLKALADATNFVNQLTAAYVRDGGALIDNSGAAITIGEPLLHTTNIVDSGLDGGLTSLGSGTLTLAGANTYNGPTAVNAGTLVFGSGSSGTSAWLQVLSNAVCTVATTSRVLNVSATVTLQSGSQLYLTNGVNQAVSNLVLNGASQAVGTWGSSSSPAAHKNDTYFSGAGMLIVGIAPPVAPTGLTATASNVVVMLSWTGAAGATSYNVKRATVNGGPYTVITNVISVSYNDSGLVGGTYYYVVSAVNDGGESTNSSETSTTIIAMAPIGLTATPASSNQISLSWTASTGATSYNVKRATVSGGPYTAITNVTGVSYNNSGLASGTYYYVVSAVNAAGESANSSEASATTLAIGPKYWVGASGTINAPTNGTWLTSSGTVWSDGSVSTANATWTAGDTAVFGGVDGTYGIAVGGAISMARMNFLASGYTLNATTAQTITAANSPFITVASGETDTIGANITVTIGTAASFGATAVGAAGGTLVIENGGVVQETTNKALSVIGAAGTVVRVKTGGILQHLNTQTGSSFIQIGQGVGDNPTVSIDGGTLSIARTTQSINVPSLSTSGDVEGVLTLNSGVVTTTGGNVNLGGTTGNKGTLNLNGGTLTAGAVTGGAGTSIMNFNGGRLMPTIGAQAAFVSGLTAAYVRNSGAVITNNDSPITIVQALLHTTNTADNVTDGGLTKLGAAPLTLLGANTYNGPTIVSAGKLVTTTSSTGAGAYTVANGAALEVQVNSAGTSLTNSSLTLGTSAATTLNFALGANGSQSVPVVKDNGTLALNGTVMVNVTCNDLSAGTYVLLQYGSLSGSGSFVVGALPASGTWSVTHDTVNKQLKLVGNSGAVDDFEILRRAWRDYSTGGTNLNLSDPIVSNWVANVGSTASGNWASMNRSLNRTYLWSNASGWSNNSADITTHYYRLNTMAIGWATKGSSVYTNAMLAADILSALDWMYTNVYNQNISLYDNWWDWDVGSPNDLNNCMVLMYPLLYGTQITNYCNAIDHFVPTVGLTADNRVWLAEVVGVRGVNQRNAAKVAAARDGLSDVSGGGATNVFVFVTSDDGFYRDGSFIQHHVTPYTGGYGWSMLADTVKLVDWLGLSQWHVTDPLQTNVVYWCYNSFQPLIYYGAMPAFVQGRGISGSQSSDFTVGHDVINAICRKAQSATGSDKTNLNSMVKYWAQVDPTTLLVNYVDIDLVPAVEQLMTNASVIPRGELIGHYRFPSTDRVMHLRPGFGFGISMFSSRIANYESINGNNLHGWFLGYGMNYYYTTNDLTQFATNYWPTIDPYHLPGTTIDLTALANSVNQAVTNKQNWVGGCSLSSGFGVTGMSLADVNTPLVAKKSWFMFDDEVVCLGAGITDSTASNVNTTVENRLIGSANTNVFKVNGTAMPTTLGWSSNLTGVSWCSLDASGGYYFPSGANLTALRPARTGKWSDIDTGGSSIVYTQNYVTLIWNHGVRPTNATYAYVLLPNFSATAVSNYAISPEIVILTNTPVIQAVRESTLNILAANFWNNGSQTIDILTVSNRCSVICSEANNVLEIDVSDPTQTNATTIALSVNYPCTGVLSADSGVTVVQTNPVVKLSVNVNGARGKTFQTQLSTSANLPLALTGGGGTNSTSPVGPPTLTGTWNGANLLLNWPSGCLLLQATNLNGPWTTNMGATPPTNITPSEPQMFYRVISAQ